MNCIRPAVSWGAACVLVLILAGCGSGQPAVQTGTVTGKVTLDNQPVSGVTVTFFGDKSGEAATGDTAADGTYTLLYSGGKNVPIGQYKIEVKAKQIEVIPTPGSPAPVVKESPVPAKYGAIATSELKAEIKPEVNTVHLPLQKQ